MLSIVAYLLGGGAQLEVALDMSNEICYLCIILYLLGGGAQLEVALDDVIV